MNKRNMTDDRSSTSTSPPSSPHHINFHSVSRWTVAEVTTWLRTRGHGEDIIGAWTNEWIDGKSLLLLTELDLKLLTKNSRTLGELKRLHFDVIKLQRRCAMFSRQGWMFPNSDFGNYCYCCNPYSGQADMMESEDGTASIHFINPKTGISGSFNQYRKRRWKKRLLSLAESEEDSTGASGEDDTFPDNDDEPRSSAGEIFVGSVKTSPSQQPNSRQHEAQRDRRVVLGGYATNLKPEIGKAVVALIYVFVVTWVTSLTMVVVHDRVPSMEKFPPLPDLFLDNIPHIPYAFEMCEVTGTILFCLFLGVLFFHKYRFILIRRFFALCGTVFLLRCVTMLITSLSVPGAHLKCNPRPYEDWFQRLHYAYLIWKGAGMSIQGVRTCGDYMFSGHTVALTMLNFFVTEYTTRRMYYLHTLSWLLNMFGIFFILAAHEHYSIDVFIAFYITSRLFLYYHTLANNQALMQRDSKRTKVWFPLFSYFESQVNGIIPNQYEWPITTHRLKKWSLRAVVMLENKWKDLVPNPNEGFLRTKFFFKPTATTSGHGGSGGRSKHE